MNPTNPQSNRTKPAAPNQARPDLPHVGRFQVLAELGRGGMGAVYRARDPELNRDVAIKVLPPEVARDAVAKARFLREARAQAAVEHEHVVTIYDAQEENGVAYIVMPVLKGQPLSAALKQNPRPPVPELVRVGREIAEGLAAAHAAGLVHRDIKPGNVWLEAPKRRVKILDFGIARGTVTAPGSRDDANPLTARGELLGTPHYMSPEQARSKPVDFRSDLFSLGVVLYQMATGARPFDGETSFDVMAAVVSEHPPAVAEVVPGFPPVLSDLIDRLLAKSPDARPDSALAVAEELEHVLNTISMRSVVVLPLPDAAGDAPNPWAELDTTHGSEPETRRGDATRRVSRAADTAEAGADTDAEPRTYRAPRGGAPKWLLPAALAGLLAAVALVAMLWPKGGDKGGAKVNPPPDGQQENAKKAGTGTGKKQPTPPKDHERELAVAVLPYAELVLELTAGGKLTVPPNGVLPDVGFAVSELNFQPGALPPAEFRAGTLIPKLVAANGVRVLLDRTGRLGYWNDDEWGAFCNTKSKDALVKIEVFAPFTDLSLNRTKGFALLSSVRFIATHAEPVPLRGLRDLKLESLALDMLGREVAPVPDTWKALAELKVRSLFLWNVNGLTPDAADVLAAATGLTEFGVGGKNLTEPALVKLFARQELTSVAVSDCPAATDTVCDAILNRPRLDYVELDRVPNVTAAGVAAIREKHPDARVVWDGEPPPKSPKATGLVFDGETNRVAVEKFGFDGKLPLTIEAWVTPASFGKDGSDRHLVLLGTLRGGSGGLGFTPADGLGVGVRLKDGGGFATNYSSNKLKAGERVHVAAVVSQKRIEFFANGKEVGWKDVDLPATVEPIPGPAAIGGTTQHSGGLNFHGTIHGLRVSRAVRYQKDKAFAPPATFAKDADTLALYKFDEGTGTKVTDHSGNGYHGEVQGTATWAKK